MNRRAFLKSTAAAITGYYIGAPNRASALQPLRAVINLEFVGGADPLGFYGFTSGAMNDVLRRRRGNIYFDPATGIDLGFGQGVALHPALAPLAPYFPKGKLVINASNSKNSGQTRSHENAQSIMTVGGNLVGSKLLGWKGRLYDSSNAELIGFTGSSGLNYTCESTRCRTTPPLVLDQFENFRFEGSPFWGSLGGATNTIHTMRVIEQFASLNQQNESNATAKYNAGIRAGFSRSREIQNIASLRTPQHLRYESEPGIDAGLAARFRNIAQFLMDAKNKQTGGNYVFGIGAGGFDMHANYNVGMPQLVGSIATTLRVFFDDLVSLGLFNDVVLFTSTEFGRKIPENQNGTDHGDASATFVFGGKVDGGPNARRMLLGSPISPTELNTLDAFPARVDNRNIISDTLEEILGISYLKAFPDRYSQEFVRERLNLFVRS